MELEELRHKNRVTMKEGEILNSFGNLWRTQHMLRFAGRAEGRSTIYRCKAKNTTHEQAELVRYPEKP
jgi:hypothetical protein